MTQPPPQLSAKRCANAPMGVRPGPGTRMYHSKRYCIIINMSRTYHNACWKKSAKGQTQANSKVTSGPKYCEGDGPTTPNPGGETDTMRVMSYNLYGWNALVQNPWKAENVYKAIREINAIVIRILREQWSMHILPTDSLAQRLTTSTPTCVCAMVTSYWAQPRLLLILSRRTGCQAPESS